MDRVWELIKKKHCGKLAPSELDRLEREIASTGLEIGWWVYDLFDNTVEERKLIEGELWRTR